MKRETWWGIDMGERLLRHFNADGDLAPLLFPRRKDAARRCASGERPVKVELVPAAPTREARRTTKGRGK